MTLTPEHLSQLNQLRKWAQIQGKKKAERLGTISQKEHEADAAGDQPAKPEDHE